MRWIIDFNAFEAYDDTSNVRGIDPIYKYGIIMEVGTDKQSVVVCCYEKNTSEWVMLNLIHDKFEVLN